MDDWGNDIEKYLRGELTSSERHALEKKALNDPFLADALEGAETISASQFSSDLSDLNKKIHGENKWKWPLRIAASVIGIALISSVIIFSIQDNSQNLASNNVKKEEGQSVKPQLKDSVDTVTRQSNAGEKPETKVESGSKSTKKEEKKREELLALNKTTKNEIATASKPKPTETGPDKLTSSGQVADQSALLSAEIVRDTFDQVSGLSADFKVAEAEEFAKEDLADNALEGVPALQPTVSNLSGSGAISRSRKSTSASLMAKGIIHDQRGRPLSGVHVAAEGSGNSVTTNAEGKYSITIAMMNEVLIFSFSGINTQEKSSKELDVSSQGGTGISSIVFPGRIIYKEGFEPTINLAEPVIGLMAYNKYLSDNKLYPKEAADNKVEGYVVVEFLISETGDLVKFNVMKSIGFECDEEVIRLIRTGPRWKPSVIDNKPVESSARVNAHFVLPGK